MHHLHLGSFAALLAIAWEPTSLPLLQQFFNYIQPLSFKFTCRLILTCWFSGLLTSSACQINGGIADSWDTRPILFYFHPPSFIPTMQHALLYSTWPFRKSELLLFGTMNAPWWGILPSLPLCWCLGMLSPLRVSEVLLSFRWVFGLLMLSSLWMIDWVPTDSLCGFGKDQAEFGGWGYRLWAQKGGAHIHTVIPSVPMAETISVCNSSPMSFSLWHHDCKSTKGSPGFEHGTHWLLPATFPSWSCMSWVWWVPLPLQLGRSCKEGFLEDVSGHRCGSG